MNTTAIDLRDCDTVGNRLDLVTADTPDDGLLVFVDREIAQIHDGDHFEFHYDDGGTFVVRATEHERERGRGRGLFDLVDVEGGATVDTLDADEYDAWVRDGTLGGLELVN